MLHAINSRMDRRLWTDGRVTDVFRSSYSVIVIALLTPLLRHSMDEFGATDGKGPC